MSENEAETPRVQRVPRGRVSGNLLWHLGDSVMGDGANVQATQVGGKGVHKSENFL